MSSATPPLRAARLARSARTLMLCWPAAVLGAACVGGGPAPTSGPTETDLPPPGPTSSTASFPPPEAPPVPPGVPVGSQPAKVEHVVDGDTLELTADAPGPALRAGTVDVRLVGVDTPETTECFGPEATASLGRLAPVGSTVWTTRDQELTDRYGRHLAYLWNDAGVFVNGTLVESGHAEALTVLPNQAHRSEFEAAESRARSAGAGLWSACAARAPSTSTSTTPQDSAPVVPPPPEPVAPEVPSEPPATSEPAPAPDPAVPGPDLDCADLPENNIPLPHGDPHGLDADGDGFGCDE